MERILYMYINIVSRNPSGRTLIDTPILLDPIHPLYRLLFMALRITVPQCVHITQFSEFERATKCIYTYII